jgi:hypothetical protein
MFSVHTTFPAAITRVKLSNQFITLHSLTCNKGESLEFVGIILNKFEMNLHYCLQQEADGAAAELHTHLIGSVSPGKFCIRGTSGSNITAY